MQHKQAQITVVLLLLLSSGGPLWAHGGHDDAFENAAPTTGQVKVAPEVQKALGIKVTPVEEQLLSTSLQVNGQIQAIPSQSAQIHAPVAGRVLRVQVQPGQAVQKGQTLVVLDSPEIRQLAVEAERTRTQAQAQVTQAQARVNLAQSTYEREQELVNLKISARKDFQVAEAELRQAQADLAAARAQVKLSGALLTNRLAQLGQVRSDGRVALLAPFAGVATNQQVSIGEAVEPGKMLFEVVNLNQVWAVAQVYEKDLGRVRPTQAVEVMTESYPGKTFRGRISSLDPIVNAETRTLAVRAVLANPGGLLKPQMFATLRLITGRMDRPVTVIARSAVLDVEGKKIVYVQNGDAFVPTEVQLGQMSGNLVEVTDGVFPGDQVVTQRAFQLRAEALKGSIPAEDSASGQVAADSAPTPEAASTNTLPFWVWLLGGLGFSVGTFFAGLGVACRTMGSVDPVLNRRAKLGSAYFEGKKDA
ncbi:efflux RND transporter periplasmic adaptor subunit [Anthocerotibacter panamensis]|uniref:efflux RND transporter periplasmic adaptor subunit n=1 Tax=Anthocerotibacter panamensis TaxID=2857077 RepID=UPI001C40385E|nr:efflux RND transporter periplasmic adaptor subunit [Anthocerotibacter panamensis]